MTTETAYLPIIMHRHMPNGWAEATPKFERCSFNCTQTNPFSTQLAAAY